MPEIVVEHGGAPVRTRVGHSFIKARMAETGAVFGGEHSGHFYFRDFWCADSGMLAALHVLAALGEPPRARRCRAARAVRRATSPPARSTPTVADAAAATAARSARRSPAAPGVTLRRPRRADRHRPDGWWFNVRPSNTEPLLRLNVEAPDRGRMDALRDEVARDDPRGGRA